MRIATLVLSATVAATTAQASLSETYSVYFWGVVDHLGTNAPRGAKIGDPMSGHLTFRVEHLDPGAVDYWTYIATCWIPPAADTCTASTGTKYQFLDGWFRPAGLNLNMWGSDGMSIDLQDGQIVGLTGYYAGQVRFFWGNAQLGAAGNTHLSWN